MGVQLRHRLGRLARRRADDVQPGQTLVYALVVTNAGPVSAVGAQLSASLPPELGDVVWASIAVGGAAGPAPAGTAQSSNRWTYRSVAPSSSPSKLPWPLRPGVGLCSRLRSSPTDRVSDTSQAKLYGLVRSKLATGEARMPKGNLLSVLAVQIGALDGFPVGVG
jgi:uncharacterized repeat protein (TIGR01451 family)